MDENAQEDAAVKSRDQLIILGRKLEKDCNVGETLRQLNKLLGQQDASWIRERLDDITDNYHRMSDFYLQGYEDPQRQQFYQQLAAQLDGVIRDLILEDQKAEYPYLKYLNPQRQIPSVDDMRQQLESYVTDMAMASLSALNGTNNNLADIHKRHANNLRSFFNLTVASPQWRHEYAVSFEDLLLSPAIDSADAQLLVSAVTLACLLVADAEKILTLIHVFQKSQDERVKQRAFVRRERCLVRQQREERIARHADASGLLPLCRKGQRRVAQEYHAQHHQKPRLADDEYGLHANR